MTAVPSLLALAAGKKVRARGELVITPRESKLQTLVADTLRDHCLPGWEWTHINRTAKDAREGKIMRDMGVRPGWPDFVFLSPDDRLHCLELKRPGVKLSDAQEEFRLRRVARGTPYAICRAIGEVLDVFEAWGCLRVTRLRRAVAERDEARP